MIIPLPYLNARAPASIAQPAGSRAGAPAGRPAYAPTYRH